MKLCLLAFNGSVHNQKWVQALSARKDMEVHMITYDKGSKFKNVTYHYLKQYTNTRLDYFLNLALLRRIVKKIVPDLLHAHYATSYGFMGARTGFHPFIITGWGADIFDSPRNFFMKILLKYSFKRADAITVLSEVTQKEIAKLTNKEIGLIPFGVDIEKFSPAPKHEGEIVRIGTVRTLSEKYGVEYLIRAFAILAPKNANLRFEIVGDGPQRKFLETLALELGLQGKITFHGFVSQTEEFSRYISIIRTFDIFTILSVLDSETFGVAAVEAMACAIPVVASNVGGLPEVVDDQQAGFIVPARDPAATALAIGQLATDAQLRKKMGEYGRGKVERIYNWRLNVEKMVSLYQEVLEKRK